MPNLSYDQPILHPLVPDTDLQSDTWFDGDSEGPFTLAQIEPWIAERPASAASYHITGKTHLNYEALLPDRLRELTRSTH